MRKTKPAIYNTRARTSRGLRCNSTHRTAIHPRTRLRAVVAAWRWPHCRQITARNMRKFGAEHAAASASTAEATIYRLKRRRRRCAPKLAVCACGCPVVRDICLMLCRGHGRNGKRLGGGRPGYCIVILCVQRIYGFTPRSQARCSMSGRGCVVRVR